MGTRVGEWLGALVAPWFAAASAARQARAIHPVGVLHAGTVTAIPGVGEPIGQRLEGGAILRFSGALWRRERAPDVLGLAIRFRRDRPLDHAPADGDQDLILATMADLATAPVALLTTDPHDFLANTYTGGAPFRIDGLGRVRIRARPEGRAPGEGDRAERLARAAHEGRASLVLEAVGKGWRIVPIARITIGERLPLDEQVLGFHPFHDGAGIRPVGIVQDMRRRVYPASQTARRRAAGYAPPVERASAPEAASGVGAAHVLDPGPTGS